MEIWGSNHQKIKNIEQPRPKFHGSYKKKLYLLRDRHTQKQADYTQKKHRLKVRNILRSELARMEPWCTWNHKVYHCFVIVRAVGPTFKSKGYQWTETDYRLFIACTGGAQSDTIDCDSMMMHQGKKIIMLFKEYSKMRTLNYRKHPELQWGSAVKKTSKKFEMFDIRIELPWTRNIRRRNPLEKSREISPAENSLRFCTPYFGCRNKGRYTVWPWALPKPIWQMLKMRFFNFFKK